MSRRRSTSDRRPGRSSRSAVRRAPASTAAPTRRIRRRAPHRRSRTHGCASTQRSSYRPTHTRRSTRAPETSPPVAYSVPHGPGKWFSPPRPSQPSQPSHVRRGPRSPARRRRRGTVGWRLFGRRPCFSRRRPLSAWPSGLGGYSHIRPDTPSCARPACSERLSSGPHRDSRPGQRTRADPTPGRACRQAMGMARADKLTPAAKALVLALAAW